MLFTLLDSAALVLLGVNEWALRVMNIICTIITLFLFLKILRHLFDDITALLAGLFFCLFPLTAFFGVNMWLYPLAFLAFWCYLAIIGALRDVTEKKWHKIVLAAAIFLAIQMTWEGFFFAMALGVHYVCLCIKRRKKPDWILFSILAIAPFASLALDFTILAAGQNWDFKRLFELARIRSTSGELGSLTWSMWFGRFLEHALTNFSLPVLIAVLFSITFGQIYAALNKKISRLYTLRFNQFWLFVMPAFFQLVLLRGTLYPHQYWERPMVLGMAVGTALAIMVIFDILKKYNFFASIIASAAITILLCAGCIYGINYYYGIRWENPTRMKMFKDLNSKIPTGMALLSVEPLTVDQFPGIKAASYRPEIAWYLDREIVPCGEQFVEINSRNSAVINIPKFLDDIAQKAKTGRFKYYMVPALFSVVRNQTEYPVTNLKQVIDELSKRYKIDSENEYIPWESRKVPWTQFVLWIYTLNPRAQQETFYRRGMLPTVIFDLSSPPSPK